MASPYSHKSQETRDYRIKAVCEVAAYYVSKGYFIYSPISHSHGLVPFIKEPDVHGFKLWEKHDFHMLNLADELWILKLDGWNYSVGVTEEIKYWNTLIDMNIRSKKIIYINPNYGF